MTQAKQIQGKELSYNNIADSDTALECVRQFDSAGCVIVKHANPCGAARAGTHRRSVCTSLSHRSRLRLRRRHCVQSRIGCGDGPRDRRPAIRRSDSCADRVGRGAGGVVGKGQRARAASRRVDVSRDATARIQKRCRRSLGADTRQRRDPRPGTARGDEARSNARRARRSDLRLAGREICQIQWHRLRQGQGDGGHRRRADEPRGQQ